MIVLYYDNIWWYCFTAAQKFLSLWCKEDEESHPALEILKKLLKTSDLLSPTVSNYNNLC